MWRLAALAVLALGGTAAAQGAAADEAARLFQEGNALREGGRYTEACDRFARSYVLDRAVGTELNLADCAERQNQVGRAWHLWDEAAREAERQGNAPTAKFAQGRAAALAPKLATVVVQLADATTQGLTVKIGGYPAPPAPRIVRLDDPGSVDVDVTAPGLPPFHKRIRAARGETVTVAVPSLGHAAVVAPPPPGPGPVVGPPIVESPHRRRGRVRAAYITGGMGVGLLGVSLTVAVLARSSYEDRLGELGCSGAHNLTCPAGTGTAAHAAYDSENHKMLVADGAALVGAALVITGIALYATAPRESLTVAPVATPTSAGLAIVGTF